MAAFRIKTFRDIMDAVREETKIQAEDNVSRDRIRRDINMVYEQEVLPNTQWKWLRERVDLIHPAVIRTGTASVTKDSTSITLTDAPAASQKGNNFGADGKGEIYKIAQHTAGSTTLILEAAFQQETSPTINYKLWSDRVILPSDCRETFEVQHDFTAASLSGLGYQEFRQRARIDPKEEGRPRQYTTSQWTDPNSYEAIAGLPGLSTRSSNGLVKTLTFASTVNGFISVNDRLEISGSGNSTYNGKFVISSVNAGIVQYTGKVRLTEVATADGALTVKSLTNQTDEERFRVLLVHPSIFNDEGTVLHVDYIKQPLPLENDTDEPLIPLEDRIVLLYGALAKTWSRERNPEEAAKNFQLFKQKLAHMKARVDDSTDAAKFIVSRGYLISKRARSRIRRDFFRFD